MHSWRSAWPVVVLLAAALGCTSPSEDTAPVGAVDRLLVVTDDANVVTLDPDGGSPLAITSGAGGGVRHVQPTWSPDARRIAFAEIAIRNRQLESSLVTTAADGSDRTDAATQLTPIYLHWDPSGTHVAFLGTSPLGIELRLVDLEEDPTRVRTLVFGSPLYFSWARGGEELLTHVRAGSRRGALERVGIDGSRDTVEDSPGLFQAPDWSGTEGRAVYAVGSGAAQRLVVADRHGAVRRTLARIDGLVHFSVDPSGTRVAFAVERVREPGANLRAVALGPGAPPPLVGSDTLSVADLDDGTVRDVAHGPVVLVQWSPRGDALLFATLETAGGERVLGWHVWDGVDTHHYATAVPTSMFAQDYLPFADQYSRSMTLWAPHGDAFAYAARDDAGDGIWVQRLGEPEPRRVADGRMVTWSPR